MSVSEKLIEMITSRYTQEPNSNIAKIIRIIADQLNDLKETDLSLKEYQDIDSAVGKVLDRFGKDVGQERMGMEDDPYRFMIKTKDQANFSNGDIETINEMMETLLGNHYIELKESWRSSVNEYEPAALELYIDPFSNSIPSPSIKRVISDGVQVHWHVKLRDELIRLKSSYTQFEVPYLKTNTFRTEARNGAGIYSELKVEDLSYGFQISYPICNTFRAGEER